MEREFFDKNFDNKLYQISVVIDLLENLNANLSRLIERHDDINKEKKYLKWAQTDLKQILKVFYFERLDLTLHLMK